MVHNGRARMNKVSAVYQIINTVTGDRYVGSSKDVFHRWAQHKCPSTWKSYPNSLMYKDFQKYGLDKFRFQILAPVEQEYLKQVEQEFIDMLKPTYNDKRSKGWNFERIKESSKKSCRKYKQSEKGKEYRRKYLQQLCLYNGETLTLNTLRARFHKAEVEHSYLEAKKYLIKGEE